MRILRVLFILLLYVCAPSRKTEHPWLNGSRHCLSAVQFDREYNFYFFRVVPKYSKCSTFSKFVIHLSLLYFFPCIFFSRDMNTYFGFLAFTSISILLLATNYKVFSFTSAQYVLSQEVPFFLNITFSPVALLCHDCRVFYRKWRDHGCITWPYRGL